MSRKARILSQKFKAMGFEPLPQPEESRPKAPSNVTALDGKELGNLIANYTAWREYTEDLLASHQMRLALTKEDYDYEYSVKWLSTEKGSGTQEDKKKTVKNSLKEKYDHVLQEEIMVDVLVAKVESYTNVLTMLSREITRRTDRSF